jgi:rubrerythrin
MIIIDFSVAIALFVLLVVNTVLLLWLRDKKQTDKNLTLDTRFVWFCSICAYTYINTRDENISLCPRCGSYNKK